MAETLGQQMAQCNSTRFRAQRIYWSKWLGILDFLLNDMPFNEAKSKGQSRSVMQIWAEGADMTASLEPVLFF